MFICVWQLKSQTVSKPNCERKSNAAKNVTIEKIISTNNSTIIYFKLTSPISNIFFIENNIHIIAKGKKYKKTLSGVSCDINSPEKITANIPFEFTILFEIIPKNTETIDIVENSEKPDNCLNFYGVQLTNSDSKNSKKVTTAENDITQMKKEEIKTTSIPNNNTQENNYKESEIKNKSLPYQKYNSSLAFNSFDFSSNLDIGYFSMDFTNPTYAANANGLYFSNKGGFEISYKKYTKSPFIFEGGFFYNSYSYQSSNIKEIYAYGVRTSILCVLLPTPKFILPYGGVGLQCGEIIAKVDNKDEVGGFVSPIWKIGLKSLLFSKYGLYFEYSQSFLSSKSFNQIAVGVCL